MVAEMVIKQVIGSYVTMRKLSESNLKCFGLIISLNKSVLISQVNLFCSTGNFSTQPKENGMCNFRLYLNLILDFRYVNSKDILKSE